MVKRIALSTVLLISCFSLAGKVKTGDQAPSAAELAAITARGRMLADYDVAAWHATDAVVALSPERLTAQLYIARKIGNGWEVAFGRLSKESDTFLVVYRATQGGSSTDFTVSKNDPPVEDRGFYLYASRAVGAATEDFGRPQRQYNTYVFPAENGQLYVYFLPAQTSDGVYPLGGDVRYTVASDGSAIVEKRQMHKTILEFDVKDTSTKIKKIESGIHTHVLSDRPEDSDVFYVLNRKPSIPEYIGTMNKKIYIVETDGSIKLGK